MTLVQVGALLQLDSSMELCGFKLAMVSKSWTCKWRTFYHSLAPTFCVKCNSGQLIQLINEQMGHQWHTTCQHHLVSKWESYCGLCRDGFVRRPGILQNRRFISISSEMSPSPLKAQLGWSWGAQGPNKNMLISHLLDSKLTIMIIVIIVKIVT